MPANLENSAVAAGLEKSAFIPIPKKGKTKESSSYHTMTFISHASKIMLRLIQIRFEQYMNQELTDVQAAFRKGRGSRVQISHIHWIIEKAKEFQKNNYFCFTDYTKSFWLCGSPQVVENS